MGSFSRLESYERALFARQIVVTTLPAAIYLLPQLNTSRSAVLYLAGAATVLNFFYYLLFMKGWLRDSIPWSRLVLDILLWSCLLYLTGGAASIFYIGFLIEILISAIAISSAGCLIAGFLSTVAYAVILFLRPGLLSLEQGLSRAAALLVTGAIAFVLIRRIESHRRRVDCLNQKLTQQMAIVQARIAEMGQRLARAETLSRVGETASVIAHEMTNTVHGLRGFLSILRNDLSADPHHARVVTLIEAGIENLEEIGEEVLSQSRSAGESEAPVDLHNLMQEVVAFVRQEHPRVATEIFCSRSIRPVHVWAGRGVLRRALINLVKNSLQAISGDGRLTIHIVRQGVDEVRIEVADTGAGVPAEIRERIFEPFVTARVGGNGLGLALSRKAIRRGGGEIELTRTSDEGTVMTVVMPLHREADRAMTKAPARRGPLLVRG